MGELVDRGRVVKAFVERFGEPPRWIARSPGRVNLIGEHTDYNDGFVLPMAIDRAVWIALRPRADRRVIVHSLDYDESAEFSLDALEKGPPRWIEYLKGTAWSLASAGRAVAGWEGIVAGDVPVGAGLSSSAALEMATARALAAVSGFDWEPVEMAKLCQRAENEWVGVGCGIMDQLIAGCGREDHAVLIDCRSLRTETVPMPPEARVAILDTGTRRGLVDSAYNERRRQCAAAAEFFRVPALRDVDLELFERTAGEMDETTRRRALHVITENDRTLRAADALRRGETAALGALMRKSHESLRDDYGVSSDALDAMVDCASAHPACLGARMTGAGFGGCAVALVRADGAEAFAAETTAAYHRRTGHEPAVYVCRATAGAQLIEP